MSRLAPSATCLAALVALCGCVGQIDDTSLDTCTSPQEYFAKEVWQPFMADTCAACHNADGIAAATRMRLRTSGSDADMAYNLELLRQLAKIEYKGTPLIVAKPAGELDHGGGVVFANGSGGLRAMNQLARMLADPTVCSGTKSCDDLAVLPARVWRLTPEEYEATVQAALGEPMQVASRLASDERIYGFSNNADVLDVSQLYTEQLMTIAVDVGARVVARIGEFAPQSGCVARDCAKAFGRRFATALFRRPPTEEEVAQIMGLYDAAATGGTYADGISLMAQGIVQAPQTIYRSELGPENTGVQTLTSDEIATSMAYMLTGKPPDDQLRALAADGVSLTEADVRRAEAQRLYDSPDGRAHMVRFVTEWLGLTELDLLEKDTNVYPAFTPSLRTSMGAETRAFIESVIYDNEGTYAALMSAPYSFVNDELAALYGMSAPGGPALVRVDLPYDDRAGILTQASILARYAHANESGPVLRGKFVRQNLLCQVLPPPPNVNAIVTPPPDPSLTTRERFGAHTGAEACRSCHALIDPIGFGFERYDGIGRARDTENGKPVDASGALDDADGTSRDFVGGAELARLLANSEEARSCFVTQLTRFAQGHTETINDVCGINDRTKGFAASGTSIYDLVVDMVASNNFIRRKVPE